VERGHSDGGKRRCETDTWLIDVADMHVFVIQMIVCFSLVIVLFGFMLDRTDHQLPTFHV